jgi:hypothetical protein
VSDCAGNSATWVQTITVVDETAPELVITFTGGGAAADTTVSCMADVPSLDAESIDGCDDSPFMSMMVDTTNADVCGNATLTYSFMTADDCGNMAQATITITVLDEEAPMFLDVCGIEDGATIDVCADDYTGEGLTPATDPCDVSAADNCEGEVTVDLMTTAMGEYAQNDSVVQFCTTVTPEAFSDEETCNGYETHAMRLFNFSGGEFYSNVGTGLVSQLANGDWVITQTIVDNANPIDYDYTATDCSGNEAVFGYTVNVTGTVCEDVESGLAGDGGSANSSDMTPALASMENRGPIQVSNIAPNPTQDYAQIGFNVLQTMRIDVSLFDAAGMLVSPLFNGQVTKDQSYVLDINAAQLESGVYQVRISSNEVSIVKQFMVTE